MKYNFSNQVSAFEAKTHLSSLLQRVAKGEKFTIQKHNTPIAVLMPILSKHNSNTREAIKNLSSFRRGKNLAGLKIKDLISEGRKW